jgi:hypothetical protein
MNKVITVQALIDELNKLPKDMEVVIAHSSRYYELYDIPHIISMDAGYKTIKSKTSTEVVCIGSG